MNLKKLLARHILIVVSAFSVMASAQTVRQTARQWGAQSASNSDAAAQSALDAFSLARTECINHYHKIGNDTRAQIVKNMQPNLHELFGRLHLATTAQPDADVKDVMRGYIVDASAQLMPKPGTTR